MPTIRLLFRLTLQYNSLVYQHVNLLSSLSCVYSCMPTIYVNNFFFNFHAMRNIEFLSLSHVICALISLDGRTRNFWKRLNIRGRSPTRSLSTFTRALRYIPKTIMCNCSVFLYYLNVLQSLGA